MNIPGINSLKTIKAEALNLPLLQSGMSVSEITHNSPSLTNIDFIPGTCAMSVNEKLTAAGTVFDISISLTVQGDNDSFINLLPLLISLPYYFIASDNSGKHYLVGTESQSNDKVSYSFKIDADANGGRSISFVISSKSNVFPVYVQ